jgi:hypothetical protein
VDDGGFVVRGSASRCFGISIAFKSRNTFAFSQGVTELERISYEEAREWFWVRTAVWFVPAYISTAMGCFVYAGTMIENFKARVMVSLLSALVATLLGLIAASISRHYPWMRLGWRKLWPLNTLISAVMAAFFAIGLSGVILTLLRENPDYITGNFVFDTASSMMGLGIIIAAFWGAAFGAWFALRHDRYFVESI